VTGADGTASTFPDEYYAPAEGREPLGFLLHLAGAGYHGILARDLLAVRREEPAGGALVDLVGEAPSIALSLTGPDGAAADGAIIVAPDRAAAEAADGSSLPWGGATMTLRAHPTRPLLLGTLTGAGPLPALFEAY
jgi:hypothetical protein